MTPTIVAEPLANHVGKKMPAASADPSEARTPIIPLGSTASPAVLIARKSAIALVAVPGRLFSLSSSWIALMPNGVAALPRPSMLAEMLRIIAPMAGLSAGTPGKSRRMSGRTSRATVAIRPPFSATRISPRKNAMTPTSPIARSTALRADVMIDPVRSSMRPVAAARRTEARAMETNRPLSMNALSLACDGRHRSRNRGTSGRRRCQTV